jgi:soluble lytic murein transglycosylase
MESVDGLRLEAWIEKAFRQGFYEDVLALAVPALKKLRGTTVSTKTLSLAGHSADYTGDDDRARSYFEELLKEHAGSDESVRALFRLGLMDYRKKDFISAAANFERLLVFRDADKFELRAKYWLWRSLQEIDKDRAKKIGEELARKYPLTYYGLRAQAELSSGAITVPVKDIHLQEKIYLTSGEERAWARLKMLLKAGWAEEAQAELRSFNEPTTNNARILMALYWAAAFDYPTAMDMISKCWDEDSSLMGNPFIRAAFPLEFKSAIDRQAKKNGLDGNLLRGLIRQESRFSPEAVSPAGAKGLMQIMPAAAGDMAGDLGLKKKNVMPDVFEPRINLQLGARYLERIIKRFDGNVSLALAAYNAGPEKVSRWMKARKISPQNTSDPKYEVWIDELPWSETSYYVKSVLRNLIIYRALDKGRVQLGNPVWASDAG